MEILSVLQWTMGLDGQVGFAWPKVHSGFTMEILSVLQCTMGLDRQVGFAWAKVNR